MAKMVAMHITRRTTLLSMMFGLASRSAWSQVGGPVLPRHLNVDTLAAVRRGLEYLRIDQTANGSWVPESSNQHYPVAVSSLAGLAFLAHGNTPTRGEYAPQIRQCVQYLLSCSTDFGLLTGAGQDMGRPMHGHGFALLFLASLYGMENRRDWRPRIRQAVERGVQLTAKGQSAEGGWTYVPAGGDEGSVTVTQVQALRAAHNAGLSVPPGTIEQAVQYIQRCETREGGIRYSLRSGGAARLAISAAAVATLYNAGEYDAPIAERCLAFVWREFRDATDWDMGTGHNFYCHLYAAQAFYLAGDRYWNEYFPRTRDQLLDAQASDGSWDGDNIGKAYGTAIALIILQLPYKFLPVYQR